MDLKFPYDQEINFLISELNRPIVDSSKKLEIQLRLSKLLQDRKSMIETLSKNNNYMPEIIDDSSNDED